MEMSTGNVTYETGAPDGRWWAAPDYDKHTHVIGVVQRIRQAQADRKLTDLLHATLYGGMPVMGFGLGSFVRRPLTSSGRLSLNVVRNMVGAVTSKIAAKNKPKPTFISEGGNYDLREKAQKLEKFVGGVFYESGVYAQLSRCFRDACIYGTGVLKVFESEDRVEVERVIPWELVVDDGEAIYGQPRNIYQRRYVDRLVLRAMWLGGIEDPERRAMVDAALSKPSTFDPDEVFLE